MEILFPQVKNLFIADKGYMLFDIDLAGADARCVAGECEDLGDPSYRKSFEHADKTGQKIHKVNAEFIFKVEDGKKEPFYTNAKKGVHATCYGATPPTLVGRAGFKLQAARLFQDKLFESYPGIRWRIDHIAHLVQTTRTIVNPFGYRVTFFDRPDSVINNALAWNPQSTVAEVTYRAMRKIDRHYPDVELLLQVHDSIVGQVPIPLFHKRMREINVILNDIEIPYKNPMVIPWGLKAGDKSLGECKSMAWDTL